jgi:hypothetical protein
MRAAAASGKGTGVLARGLQDSTPMVRLEALKGFSARRDDGACDTFVAAAADVEVPVVLVALDQLAVCSGHAASVKLLERRPTICPAPGCAAFGIARRDRRSLAPRRSGRGARTVRGINPVARVYRRAATLDIGNLRDATDVHDNVSRPQSRAREGGGTSKTPYMAVADGYQASAAALCADGTPRLTTPCRRSRQRGRGSPKRIAPTLTHARQSHAKLGRLLAGRRRPPRTAHYRQPTCGSPRRAPA